MVIRILHVHVLKFDCLLLICCMSFELLAQLEELRWREEKSYIFSSHIYKCVHVIYETMYPFVILMVPLFGS